MKCYSLEDIALFCAVLGANFLLSGGDEQVFPYCIVYISRKLDGVESTLDAQMEGPQKDQ